MGDREACDECKQKCSLIHGRKTDPSPLVTTFTKILFGGYDILKDLVLPQKISQAIPGLVAGENCTLQDTNGQRWEVKLGNIDDRLAFREGWNHFYEDHGLKVGYVLAFHYIINSHFVVEIFDKTGFEKLKFPVANGKKRKRSCEIDGNCNAVDQERQNLSNQSTKKHNAAISGTSDSYEARTHSQPMSKDNPLSLQSEHGKHEHIALADCDADPFYMINRDDASHHEEDRTPFLNLSNSEMQSGVDPADGIRDKRSRPTTDSDAVAGNVNEKPVSAKVVISQEPPAEVAASTLSNNNNTTPERENAAEIDNHYHGREQVHSESRKKRPTVSSKRAIEKAPRNKKNSRKRPKLNNRSGRTFGGDERNNEVRRVTKTEPVDSLNDVSLDASAFYFPAIVGSHKLLQLPTSVTLWASVAKKVVNLRGPDRRVWPVLYHNKHGIQALTSGWENFFMSCRLRIGDACDFTLEDEAETTFRVDIVNRK